MRIEYCQGVDALYINLRDVPVAESRDVQEGITLTFDAYGRLVGIEVLDASERVGINTLMNVSIENLPAEHLSFGTV